MNYIGLKTVQKADMLHSVCLGTKAKLQKKQYFQ